MMSDAWKAYKTYAWGADELRPMEAKGATNLGNRSSALTMIDGMDTLYLMGMLDEFNEARDYVVEHVNFDVDMNVSMFEMNIRIVGGLLSAYALCKDKRLVDLAEDLVKRFLASWANDFPINTCNLMLVKDETKLDREHREAMAVAGPRPASLAQVGTLSLEFDYLSQVTGNPVYRDRIMATMLAFSQMKTRLDGLYPATIHVGMIDQPDDYFSLGGQADSFYEYLFKYWLQTGKTDEVHKEMWKRAERGIKKWLVSHYKGRAYFINRRGKQPLEEMEHLACFGAGLLALSAHVDGNQSQLDLAAELCESCYLMYRRQKLGLGPEKVDIHTMRPTIGNHYYILRPEVVESIFILWRLTKEVKYRRWGLEIAQSIVKHCQISSTGGFTGINDIEDASVPKNDRQESFFLAETLKYLYLLYQPDDVIPLDKWVFNTEAHPFPIYSK